jgi:hypothetical protein
MKRPPLQRYPNRNETTRRRLMENKPGQLTATLEAAQWDLLGRLLTTNLSQHQAEVNAIQPILNSLRTQLQPKPANGNGKPVQMAPPPDGIPEVFPEPG